MNNLQDNSSNFILYTSKTGDIKVNIFLENETIWLTQKSIGELFGKSKSTISEHLKNIFKEGELDENSVVRKFRTTANDGKISHQKALEKSAKEYEKFRVIQDREFLSDFDKALKKFKKPN